MLDVFQGRVLAMSPGSDTSAYALWFLTQKGCILLLCSFNPALLIRFADTMVHVDPTLHTKSGVDRWGDNCATSAQRDRYVSYTCNIPWVQELRAAAQQDRATASAVIEWSFAYHRLQKFGAWWQGDDPAPAADVLLEQVPASSWKWFLFTYLAERQAELEAAAQAAREAYEQELKTPLPFPASAIPNGVHAWLREIGQYNHEYHRQNRCKIGLIPHDVFHSWATMLHAKVHAEHQETIERFQGHRSPEEIQVMHRWWYQRIPPDSDPRQFAGWVAKGIPDRQQHTDRRYYEPHSPMERIIHALPGLLVIDSLPNTTRDIIWFIAVLLMETKVSMVLVILADPPVVKRFPSALQRFLCSYDGWKEQGIEVVSPAPADTPSITVSMLEHVILPVLLEQSALTCHEQDWVADELYRQARTDPHAPPGVSWQNLSNLWAAIRWEAYQRQEQEVTVDLVVHCGRQKNN
jgi:hypothetical protein